MGRLSSEADKSKAELNKAFAALNVKPIHEIKEEIAQLNAAYNRLRQDGTVSAADLARAQGALQQKTAELTQQNGGWVESLSQVKGAIVGLSAQFLALGSAVNQAMDFQGLQTQFKFSFDGVAAGAAAMQFARDTANELGLSVTDTAKSFSSFAAAARGTSLQGEGVREVFTAVAQASRVMGVSSAETEGIFQALSQMMSKGVVSMEEWRQQLGEKLPIANAVGAKAMGMTTAEFGKLIESGKLMTEDFLPRFAAEMKRTLAGDVVAASQTAAVSWQRLKNDVEHLAISVGTALLPMFKAVVDALHPVISTVADLTQRFPELTAAALGLAGAATAATVLGSAIVPLKLAVIGLGESLIALRPILTATVTSASAASLAFGAIGAAIAGYAIGQTLYREFAAVRDYSVELVTRAMQIADGFKLMGGHVAQAVGHIAQKIGDFVAQIPGLDAVGEALSDWGFRAELSGVKLSAAAKQGLKDTEEWRHEQHDAIAALTSSIASLAGQGKLTAKELDGIVQQALDTKATQEQVGVLRNTIKALGPESGVSVEIAAAAVKKLDGAYIKTADSAELARKKFDEGLKAAADAAEKQLALAKSSGESLAAEAQLRQKIVDLGGNEIAMLTEKARTTETVAAAKRTEADAETVVLNIAKVRLEQMEREVKASGDVSKDKLQLLDGLRQEIALKQGVVDKANAVAASAQIEAVAAKTAVAAYGDQSRSVAELGSSYTTATQAARNYQETSQQAVADAKKIAAAVAEQKSAIAHLEDAQKAAAKGSAEYSAITDQLAAAKKALQGDEERLANATQKSAAATAQQRDLDTAAAAASKLYADALADTVKNLDGQLAAIDRQAKIGKAHDDVQKTWIDSEIKLAEALGDTARATDLKAQKTQIDTDATQEQANQERAVAATLREKLRAMVEEYNLSGAADEGKNKAIETLKGEIALHDLAARKYDISAAGMRGLIDAQNDFAAQSAAWDKSLAGQMQQFNGLGAIFDALDGRITQLSSHAGKMWDGLKSDNGWRQLATVSAQSVQSLSAIDAGADTTRNHLGELKTALSAAGKEVADLGRAALGTDNWWPSMQKGAAAVKQAFYEQAVEAETLALLLDQVKDHGAGQRFRAYQ